MRIQDIAILLAFLTIPLAAQESASITGVLTDQTGAPVGQSSVTLLNLDSKATRSFETNPPGRYVFPQLPAGTYEVRAAKQGFKTAVQSGIALAVNQSAVVNFSLALGQINERVAVEESVPLAGASGLIGGTEIRDLPLNGRSYDELLTLNPGIANYSNEKNNTTPGVSNSAVGNMFAVSGRRPQENLFLIDGIEYTGSAEIDMTPGGTSGLLLGVDAIREFNVLTDFYDAEYGKRPGAQVLIVDRSGSNDFHGSAYEFFRNSWFDARNFFDHTAAPPPFLRNQFGGSLGGPVVPDHTFFFMNYEGLRQRLDLSDVTLVPDNNARAGILPSGPVTVNPISRQLLSLWPVQSPNTPFDRSGIAEAFSTPKQNIAESFGTTRIDQNISTKDTLAASYTVDDSNDFTPTANPLALDIESLREQVATLHETHVFSPAVVNTAEAGYSRASYFYTGRPAVSGTPSFIAGEPTGAVVIGGSATPNTSSSITMAGSNNGSHLSATRNLFTYQDSVSVIKGNNEFNFGGWAQRVQSNDELALGQFGQATFSTLQAFLTGTVTTFTAVPSPTPLSWRSWEGAWFAQDKIRLTPRLTVTLGFRDEMTNGWNEAHSRASTFVYGSNGALETTPQVASSIFTTNHAKFLPQPRIGFAADLSGNGRTVLRGGFGMYNDLQDALSYRLDQNAPFNTSITLSSVPLASFPLVPGNITANYKVAPAGVQQDLYTPTVLSYMLEFEQRINANTSLTAGYAGSHAYHETLSADLNQPFAANKIPAGTPLANPALGSGWTWVSWGNSNYNSMKVDLRRRFAKGLEFRTAYTWSKSLDNGDTLNASAAANAPGLAENARNLRLDYGPSTFDVRHILGISGIYEIPFAKHATGLVNLLLGGWSINAIETYNSGFPFTPELSFNPSNNGNTTNPVRPSLNPNFSGPTIIGSPNEYFNPNAFIVPAGGTYGSVGRNAFSGPGLAELDVALVKNTRISERLKLQLRGEAFNIANHVNFNTPNLTVFSSATAPPSGSAGVITSTSTTSRQIQVAAKFIW